MVVNKYIVSSYDVCLSQCSQEGRRRNPANWTYDSVPLPQYMHRGYTFHEMLDEFGLINMNGRCYDPVVGRFLSPDIVVQNPNNTQCYNRYSYAVNNPLKYTDPSGWSYGTLDQMHDNEQHAAWLNMCEFNRRMQYESNISSVKIIGQASLKFFGSEAEGAQHFSITEIVELLKMIKTPGLFGYPGRGDPPASLSNNTSQTTPSYGVHIVASVMKNVTGTPAPSSQGNCILEVNQSSLSITSMEINNSVMAPTISTKLTSNYIPGNMLSIETYTEAVVSGNQSVMINLDRNKQYESITLKNSTGTYTIGNDFFTVGNDIVSIGANKKNFIFNVSIPYGESSIGGATLYFNKSRTYEFISYGLMVARIVYPPLRLAPIY